MTFLLLVYTLLNRIPVWLVALAMLCDTAIVITLVRAGIIHA